MLTKENIIDDYTLTFDPGDKLNGSLYIGSDAQDDVQLLQLIAGMRQENIWSTVEFKQVPDEHRPAYKEQLDFVEAIQYETGLFIARFDHPKYPSDAERWQAWKQFFAAQFA